MRKLPSGNFSQYIEKLGEFTRNAKLVLIYSAITGLAFGVFQFLFNFFVLSLDAGYNEAFLGTLQTFTSLAAIAVALPAAYAAEKFSQKRIMIITALLTAAGLGLMILVPTRPILIAARVVIGMSMSLRQVAMAPFLMANTKGDERQWVFSFNFGLMQLTSFVGNLLGGYLPTWLGGLANAAPTDAISYQLALGSMMLVMMLAVGPIAMILYEKPDRDRYVELPWHQLYNYGWPLLRFFLPQFVIGLGAGLFQPFMNVYFRNVYAMPDQPIALVFAISGLGMGIAQFLGPPLAEKRGKIGAVVISQAWSIPFLILLGLGAFLVPMGWINPVVYFVIAGIAFIVRASLMNLSNPIYQTFVLEHVPEDVQALAMSLNSISFQFGWFIMPQLGGWLQVQFGPYGFIGIFGGVVLFYVTAIIMEQHFFGRGTTESIPQQEYAANR